MVGQNISHYRILDKLGEGGMGVVYKAEDSRLDRAVALKFLAPHLVSNDDVRRRFIREAKTSAALDHPNICTVYEIAEADGRTFISMAYLEGRELAAEIAEGPIEVERALKLAAQFVEGLATAHAKGIVHRDVKPANLFVTTNNRGVILDFGLAQLATAASKLTREGTTLGTVAYMSPEQAQGEDVDARTDVWAMGCVVYEMLSGQAPFRGDYEQAIIYWILNEDPDPLEGVPPEVEAVVRRCLSKDREHRYADGGELLQALLGGESQPPRRRSAAATSQVPRAAVLPFRVRGGDAELESVAEGLTEEITAGISQFRHLVVVSASAAAAFEGTSDVRQAGKDLDARFLLEGTIRMAGSSLRVSIRLIDAATGDHLWAERIDRDLSAADIFDVQDELTDRIVSTIADSSGVLTRALAGIALAKSADRLTAHECVLRTFAYWDQARPPLHAEVRGALERAVKREPRNPEAWACLSRVILDEDRFVFNPLPNILDRALESAQQAVELDPTSQNAYRSLAEAHYYRRDFSAFRAAAERVLALNPRDTSNIGMTSQLMAYSGDWEKGVAESRRVADMNPHHAGWLNFMFFHDCYLKGDYEQALEYAEKVNMPGYNYASVALAVAHAALGHTQEARKHIQTYVAIQPDYARNYRTEWGKWFVSGELLERIFEGMHKAGLLEELERLEPDA